MRKVKDYYGRLGREMPETDREDTMKLTYGVNDRPSFGKTIIFALQQLLAILAATIAVPSIVGHGMSQSAALFGAGVGTLVYLLFTKFRSPVFLGSSFAFISPMFAAFGGAIATSVGYLGLIIGALMAGLVYVVIALAVKIFGSGWVNKLMPAVIIGPTVSIIGLSLAVNAVNDAVGGSVEAVTSDGSTFFMTLKGILCIVCALITLITVTVCSVYGKKMLKMIPFVIGIIAGYIVATVFTIIGLKTGNDAFVLIDFGKFATMKFVPDFTYLYAWRGFKVLKDSGFDFVTYVISLAVAYVPVAFVVFAEHIADHKNLSSIIEKDLLEDPGLHCTLLGDGVGSIVGAFFGGCPNTTYGESVGCVAISGNASVTTILTTAIFAIGASFFAPFVTFLSTIPSCVMGGVCIALYGFIAVSGLKMIQKVDLEDNSNLFVVSTILITGIGGMCLTFGKIKITSIACALILGIIVNVILSGKKKKNK